VPTGNDQPDRAGSPGPTEQTRDRRTAVAIVLILTGIYWLTMGGHTYSVDGETYLAGTRALVHHTTVLDPGPGLQGIVVAVKNKNGGLTTAAPIGSLILMAPGFIVGKILSIPFPARTKEEVIRLIYLAGNPLMTALTAGLLFLICRRLGAARHHATLLAVAFGLGTWAWPHGHTDFTEPGTALLLTAATLALLRWRDAPSARRIALTGFLAGCVVITRSSTALFVPVFLLGGLLMTRTRAPSAAARSAVTFGIGGLLPALAMAVNSYLRFGGLFNSGYPTMSYATPAYEGVFGLFLSSGKGIVWYAPICIVVLFALRSSYLADRGFALFVAAITVAHLAVYARFAIWSGENAYGPRYLIPLLPVFVALLAPVIGTGRQWVRGARLAAAAGFVIPGLLGSLMYFNAVYWRQQQAVFRNLDAKAPTATQQYLAWNFQPRSSPLMLEIRSLPELGRNSWHRLEGKASGQGALPVAYNQRIYWYAQTIQPDVWWLWWSARGDSGAGYGFLIAPLALLAGGLALTRSIARSSGSDDGGEGREIAQ
jgi:hypothetical protein